MKLKIADILSPGDEAATAAAVRDVERSALQVFVRYDIVLGHGSRIGHVYGYVFEMCSIVKGERGRDFSMLVHRP